MFDGPSKQPATNGTSASMSACTPPDMHSEILDSVSDGVFTVDLQWRITSFNRAAELFLVVRWQGSEVDKSFVTIPAQLPPLHRIERLPQQQIEAVICGAIWRPIQRLLEAQHVAVYSGVCGTVEQVLEAFRAGQLDSDRFRMPGCRQWGRHRRGCRKGGRTGVQTDRLANHQQE